MLSSKSLGKKAQVAFIVIFLIAFLSLVFIFALVQPLGTALTTKAYTIGEGYYIDNQETINSIQDVAIRTAINDSVNQAKASTVDNIALQTGLYKYGWIVILIIVFLTLWLLSRLTVEIGGMA